MGRAMTEILNAVSPRLSGGSGVSVAIVIPAYNEERFIGRCLASCLCQTSLPDEIIVVNNRSTDDTATIVRRFQAQNRHIDIRLLTQDEYQGIAPTRNYGFDRVRSTVIGRIDADSRLAPDWVETIRRRFRDPAVDAVTGPVWYYDMPLRQRSFGSIAPSGAGCTARRGTNGSCSARIWQCGLRRGAPSVTSPDWILRTNCTKISISPSPCSRMASRSNTSRRWLPAAQAGGWRIPARFLSLRDALSENREDAQRQ